MNKYTFIFVFWIFIFGFIVYKRSKSDTVILLGALVITYIIYKGPPNKSEEQKFDTYIDSWITTLITTKDPEEKDRSYNIIRNYLYSEALSNKKIEYSKILNLIDKYKPTSPLPSNIDNNTQYDISVGFTNNITELE